VRDIVVIGAGPAGSITARRLAERGHDVVVLEEHDVVGQPVHCTGLLGLEAFDEFDLPRELILARAGVARFWGAAGQSVSVQSGRVEAVVIDRAALDEYLAGEAARAGAEIRCGARVEGIEVGSTHVAVAVRGADQPLRARACVVACGANYGFHRQLGLGMPGVFLQSAQIETPFPEFEAIEVKFGRDVAPGGFAWLVPFKRGDVPHARIGLMSETKSRERFAALLDTFSARTGLLVGGVAPPRLKVLPLGPVARTYGHRVVAVGDAAGLVKPTTGGGIY